MLRERFSIYPMRPVQRSTKRYSKDQSAILNAVDSANLGTQAIICATWNYGDAGNVNNKNRSRYRAFMLRCWQVGQDKRTGEPIWRFTVEEVLRNKNEPQFPDLQTVFEFLESNLLGSPSNNTKQQ